MKNLIKPIPLLITLHAIIVLLALIGVIRGGPEATSLRDKIVVIPIEGIISMEPGSLRHGMTVSDLVKKLRSIRDDKSVKAVILRINSPGGTVGAVQEIYRELIKIKEKGKVVVSSFQEVSASGGYYVASAGDWIVLNPGTLTGSIGVIMQIPNVNGLLQKFGISMNTIKSGKLKDAGSPFRKMTSSERSYFKKIIIDSYEQFYEAVKTGRKLEDKVLKKLTDGRIFSGRMAVKNKLADQLGGFEEALDKAKELAKIEEKPHVVYHRGKRSIDRVLEMFTKSPIKEMTQFTMEPSIQILYLMK